MSDREAEDRGRLWVRLYKGQRALRDVTVPCSVSDPTAAMRMAMHALDLSMPVWLPRHQADWKSFALTRFTPDHFMDAVTFERMEISYIAPDEVQKPRRVREE